MVCDVNVTMCDIKGHFVCACDIVGDENVTLFVMGM